MITKINHIGIAVNDLDSALKVLKDTFGVEAEGIEEVESQKVRVGFVPLGDTRIELLQPTSDDSAVAKFLAARGEGMHHIALQADDAAAALKKAEEGGARLIDKEPRPGAHGTMVGFIHPKSTFSTLIEVVQESEKH
ncbi:MAG: methylmalonyl-CoA epimerase [Bacillota bacterium]|jgi:methylmalonyl-CoA epimerase